MPPPLRAAAPFGISYRPFTDEDLPFVAALYASTREAEVAQTGWPVEAQRAFLAQQFEAQHRHYRQHYYDAEWLILERAGAAIGRLYLFEDATEFTIVDISLIPEARGQGIGAALLEDVCALARGKGKIVSIHVEKNNPARRLYGRLGFEVKEDLGVYDLMTWSPESAGGDEAAAAS
jgi:ribosomal protein S18 acetylase RimI-like enzyme